jgi:hypothetical protein
MRGISWKCASQVSRVAPARAQVAAIQMSFYGDGTPSPPKILNDLAEYLRNLTVNRQRFDDRQSQEFIQLFEISLKP